MKQPVMQNSATCVTTDLLGYTWLKYGDFQFFKTAAAAILEFQKFDADLSPRVRAPAAAVNSTGQCLTVRRGGVDIRAWSRLAAAVTRTLRTPAFRSTLSSCAITTDVYGDP